MKLFAMLVAIIALSGLTIVAGQLPCDSALRRLPAFSYHFTHCHHECHGSEWTDWLAVSRTAVPSSQCPSRSALTYERRKTVNDGDCQEIIERKTICKFCQM